MSKLYFPDCNFENLILTMYYLTSNSYKDPFFYLNNFATSSYTYFLFFPYIYRNLVNSLVDIFLVSVK